MSAVRSVRRTSAACVATLPLAAALTGCVSTQQIAARARLVSSRVLASQSTTQVGRANPNISIGRVALIHARAGTAVVVSLHNDSSTTLTDLPVSVGILSGAHHRVYLNRSANLDYFESHIAAIGPHSLTTWVFTTGRRVPGGAPFARVGLPDLHPPTAPGELPRIDVSLRTEGSTRTGTKLDLRVSNQSGVPQYDLPVYVIAGRAERAIGAGGAKVTHLGTHATTTVTLSLLGTARGAALQLIAVPTIFR
jgi:hypothetical protein